MNPIHDSDGNLIGIEMHSTRISAEAISQMAMSIDRYRVGLEAIARALVIDPYAFAQAIVEGKAVQEALEIDALNLDAEPSPEIDAEPSPEIDAGLLRIDARRELVRAALRWAKEHEPFYCETCEGLVQACKTFLALGGSEEEG